MIANLLAALVADATRWPDVAIAVVYAAPAIIAAIYARNVHAALRTPSKTSVGKQLEAAHHVALANNYRLQALEAHLQLPPPADARVHEAQAFEIVDPPEGDT